MQESIPKEAWIWIKDIILYLGGAVITLLGIIWRADRRKLKAMEERLNQTISRPEVLEIVERVEENFHKEHQNIIKIISDGHKELREDIRDLRAVVTGNGHWNGLDRRKE